MDAIGFRAQLLGIQASVILLKRLPYLATLAVMLLIALARRRMPMPSALGLPYSREG